jgi:hypothetical protein
MSKDLVKENNTFGLLIIKIDNYYWLVGWLVTIIVHV